MENDYLRQLEYLGITARIKRLSDSIFYSIKQLYQSEGVDIEPSWHLVFLYLKVQKKATMTEMAASFSLSQPAMTKMIGNMRRKGYVDIVIDAQDGRRKLLTLSPKASRELPRFERIWTAGQAVMREMLDGNEAFWDALIELENRNAQRSFKDRVLDNLATD